MKRILIAFATLVILFFAATYLLIPNRVHVTQRVQMQVNREGLMRNLSKKEDWKKWWPGKNDTATGIFTLGSRVYEPLDAKVLSVPVRISAGNINAITDLTVLPSGPDSAAVKIDYLVPTSYNPIKRIQRYFAARSLRNDAAAILKSIGGYYKDVAAMYGYDIRKDYVVDSTLFTNIKEMTGYPGIDRVYAMVDELKAYIKNQGAAETGFPMLNIFTKDSVRYLVKVAIPVNKKLADSGTMSYRWMLGGGNILITEVKGGMKEIQKAYHQIELYISDYRRVAPAIPFESLVTDRRQQPDSSKWVTRIYYPVI